jgi:hypothetical protein
MCSIGPHVIHRRLATQRGGHHHQYRLAYRIPREGRENVSGMVVTPSGMAWRDGVLYERYSLRSPAARDLLRAPTLRQALRVERATVIQGDTPYIYGDCVAEFVRILARHAPIESP